jgi:cubilin
MRFREQGLGCGGSVQLSRDAAETEITSPNYPSIPPLHSECVWTVLAPPGKRIQIDFIDNFYIRPSSG